MTCNIKWFSQQMILKRYEDYGRFYRSIAFLLEQIQSKIALNDIILVQEK